MKSALLVVDVQRSLLDEGPWLPERLLTNVRLLIDGARAAGVPVVFVRDTRVEPDSSIDPSLGQRPDDLEVFKDFCDSFLGTILREQLETRGVTRLVVCGMQTDYCIDTTCRRAASLGYAVELVREAHTTLDSEHLTAEQIIAHHNRIMTWLPAGSGAVRTVALADVEFV